MNESLLVKSRVEEVGWKTIKYLDSEYYMTIIVTSSSVATDKHYRGLTVVNHTSMCMLAAMQDGPRILVLYFTRTVTANIARYIDDIRHRTWVDRRRNYAVYFDVESLEEITAYLVYRCECDCDESSVEVARSLIYVLRDPRSRRA